MNPPRPIISDGWNPLPTHIFPWVRTLERIICAAKAPSVSGPVIYVASDYSGARKSLLYEVISILYVDMERSRDWEKQRQYVRAKFLADGRRMSFKALNDRKRQQAIVPFLQAANLIHGLAISVAVRKSITHLCTDADVFQRCVDQLGIDDEWRTATFERMVRVVVLISALIGGLSHHGQNIYWISDEDDMFANIRRSTDVKRLLERFTSAYVTHGLGELGMGTTAIDEDDRGDEDLNAIPDLMSGAIAEVTTSLARRLNGRLPMGFAVECNPKLSTKAQLIWSWVNDNVYALRRAVMVIDRRADGRLGAFRFNMLEADNQFLS